MSAAASLWTGRTRHVRHAPFDHEFSYRVAMVSVDVDRLDEADRTCSLFSIDRKNLVSLHRRKLACGAGREGLRRWATARLGEAGMRDVAKTLTLITFPNVLGSGFAPISIWVSRDGNDRVNGVIYEVHNTFGEAHAYAFAPNAEVEPHCADKEFHVSPFFDVSGSYRFSLTVREDRMSLLIQNLEDGECVHTAHLALSARELSNAAVARWLIRMPFSGFGVILAIHWQALKLWLKGARYRSKPEQRAGRTTRAIAVEQTSRSYAERRSA